jgi:hypothetical protein
MARRFIPTDCEDEMLDALANLTGDFAEGVWDALSESDRDKIYTPLVVVCKLYNEGKIDFPEDTFCDDYQAILHMIPKDYLFCGPLLY